MINAILSRTKLFKEKQEQLKEFSLVLKETASALFEEKKWAKKNSDFVENIGHILAEENAGVQLFFLPEITFVLLVKTKIKAIYYYHVYVPFVSFKPIGRASAIFPGTEAMHITGIRVDNSYQDKGVGSCLVNYIKSEGVKMNRKRITGFLNRADAGHYGKLKYFYEKHGFVVEINCERNGGTLELNLQ